LEKRVLLAILPLFFHQGHLKETKALKDLFETPKNKIKNKSLYLGINGI